ncbi:hypothetical protein BS78_05G016700 [Paspalum vaginatum]|nr:hypothetical protein BS78_05G016700 [Paspalum vaginatum]KAJ1273854.1 hypothetical protein BS78_05G016700 [Paspalum vaginatum]KAJ1273855.1 hypothetical protein BS78_05G016700 [Paspalum vaginatum]
MEQVQCSAPWSDLLPELLGLVFLHLATRADRALFRAVCHAWRSAAKRALPPPSPVPWLVLPSGTVTSLLRGETFHLPNGMRYHTSCGEWLLLTRRDDGSCFLMNPFTRATMPLPSLSSYSLYEQPVEYGDDVFPDIDEPGMWMHKMDGNMISVLSLIVCSTRLIAAIVAVGDLGAIALCRPGAPAWSVSANDGRRCLSHMVFFQGKLYALDANDNGLGALIGIDIVDEQDSDEPRVSPIERSIQGAYFPCQEDAVCMNYLLESHGSLLMVYRKLSYKIGRYWGREAGSSEFEVFKADLEQHLWADVRTLGNDQALFLGQGCSKAVCVSPYDLSGDCIFFLDDYTDWSWNATTTSCGVYDMKDEETYSPLPMVSWKNGKVPATWIFWQGEINKLETAGEDFDETVEHGEDPQALICGGTCSADVSTAGRATKKG